MADDDWDMVSRDSSDYEDSDEEDPEVEYQAFTETLNQLKKMMAATERQQQGFASPGIRNGQAEGLKLCVSSSLRSALMKVRCLDPSVSSVELTCDVCDTPRKYGGLKGLIRHAETSEKRKAAKHRGYARAIAEVLTEAEEFARSRKPVQTPGVWLDAAVKRGPDDKKIVWPPIVIVENCRKVKDPITGLWTGLGAPEAKNELFKGFEVRTAKPLYNIEGHMGIAVLQFEASDDGYHHAMALATRFREARRGKEDWEEFKKKRRTQGKDAKKGGRQKRSGSAESARGSVAADDGPSCFSNGGSMSVSAAEPGGSRTVCCGSEASSSSDGLPKVLVDMQLDQKSDLVANGSENGEGRNCTRESNAVTMEDSPQVVQLYCYLAEPEDMKKLPWGKKDLIKWEEASYDEKVLQSMKRRKMEGRLVAAMNMELKRQNEQMLEKTELLATKLEEKDQDIARQQATIQNMDRQASLSAREYEKRVEELSRQIKRHSENEVRIREEMANKKDTEMIGKRMDIIAGLEAQIKALTEENERERKQQAEEREQRLEEERDEKNKLVQELEALKSMKASQKDNDTSTECIICMEDFSDANPRWMFPDCFHAKYCKRCAFAVFNKSKKCSYCNTVLRMKPMLAPAKIYM